MPTSSNACAEAVVVTISRLSRRFRHLGEPQGLSPSQRSVLSRLDKQGPATAGELAQSEHVRPQSMAATVAALLDLDLVAKAGDPDDGRRRVLSLTPAGATWTRETRSAKQGWLAGALADSCTPAELDVIAEAMAVLDRVSDAAAVSWAS